MEIYEVSQLNNTNWLICNRNFLKELLLCHSLFEYGVFKEIGCVELLTD